MSTRGDREDPKVTARQRAYLAAVDGWFARGAEDEGLDRELVDITFDDMLDEADPTLRWRVEDRLSRRPPRPGPGRPVRVGHVQAARSRDRR